MKTDTIFFYIMQTVPEILFELWGDPAQLAQEYEFRAVEIKQLAFRLDGVFLPKPDAQTQTVIFVEVQFQDDTRFYQRFFGEIFLFLAQHPDTVDWKAIVLFKDDSIEPKQRRVYQVLLDSDKVQRLYLDDYENIEPESLGMGLIQLILAPPVSSIASKAQTLIQQARMQTTVPEIENRAIIELIETIVVYKFPSLSREEIERMLGLSELKQTKVYQEALQEGRQEGLQEGLQEGIQHERSLIFRQLTRKVGTLESGLKEQVQALSLPELEQLGEALLDFTTLTDLQAWLGNRRFLLP